MKKRGSLARDWRHASSFKNDLRRLNWNPCRNLPTFPLEVGEIRPFHPARGREALADIGELRIAGAYFLLDLKNGMHFSVSFSQTRRQLAWRQRRRMWTFGKTRLLSVLQFSGWGLRRPPRDVSRKTCITPRPINEKWHETKIKKGAIGLVFGNILQPLASATSFLDPRIKLGVFLGIDGRCTFSHEASGGV